MITQGVTNEIGDVLNVRFLVVVRQDHGIAVLAKPVDRRNKGGVSAHQDRFGAGWPQLRAFALTHLRLAIAGDLHGAWGDADEQLLQQLKPDAVLFVGDLADGDLRRRAGSRGFFPVAVILGNHDRGRDRSGGILSNNALCSAICIAPGARSNGPSP